MRINQMTQTIIGAAIEVHRHCCPGRLESETVLPIHEAQLLTYLKLGGYQVGLLLSFNVSQLRDGMVRKVLGLPESATTISASSASLRPS